MPAFLPVPLGADSPHIVQDKGLSPVGADIEHNVPRHSEERQERNALSGDEDLLFNGGKTVQGDHLTRSGLGRRVAGKPDPEGQQQIPCHGAAVPVAQKPAPAVELSGKFLSRGGQLPGRHWQRHGLHIIGRNGSLAHPEIPVPVAEGNGHQVSGNALPNQGQEGSHLRPEEGRSLVAEHCVLGNHRGEGEAHPSLRRRSVGEGQIVDFHPPRGIGRVAPRPEAVLRQMGDEKGLTGVNEAVLEIIEGVSLSRKVGGQKDGLVGGHEPEG
ncbi:hypothetical protein SDC9_64598 [bioreactor metagenome]|uniref:Uncharacterized protein n=1 Tax=bioreactor metagenome TaxID=1076179 RepID=A0A644XPQ7_9ZZZZ